MFLKLPQKWGNFEKRFYVELLWPALSYVLVRVATNQI